MRARTKKEVLVVLVLVSWCSIAMATEGANGADAERRDGDEGGGEGGGGGGEAQPQPHIVLIVADDLGWNDIPWHNSEVYAPSLESLAREGVILEQSYVQPICSPSRSALMSSRYPFTIGRQHLIWPEMPTGLNLSLTLLPQALKAVGYETHAVGKWHLGFCKWAYTPTHRGFDTFYGYYTGSEDYYHHTRTTVFAPKACNHLECALPSAPIDGEDAGDVNGPAYLDLRNNTDPDRNETGTYSSYLFASQVENLLVKRNPQVPMFLYLPFQSVHSPLQVPEKYEKPYAHIQDHNRRTYLGMVTAMDEAVGRVVQALKQTNHYNSTIIVFTTDNGGPTISGANNWPLRGNKTTIWEGGTRGAAFIHSPLLPNSGTTNPTLLHITDWLPTLVGLAGGEVPEGIDGVDQWGALTGTGPPRRTHFVYNIDNTTRFSAGVRMGKYKLLVGNPGPGEWTPPPQYFEEPSGGADDRVEDDDDDVEFEDNEIEMEDDDDDDDVEHEDIEVEIDDDDDSEEEEHEEEEEIEVIINTSHFEGAVKRLLQEMTGRNDTEVRLYDLESDPEEKHNLASSQSKVVAIMTHLLHSQLSRYTPADDPTKTRASNPHKFDDAWSPGWC